jgi:hypothetical protein
MPCFNLQNGITAMTGTFIDRRVPHDTIMQKRKLGNSELEAAPLAFGGNVFGWTLNEAASFELLDALPMPAST